MYDEDGNEYIDYISSWGASILGSAHQDVVRAVKATSTRGLSFGAATRAEFELAERIKKKFPSIELLRLVSSGTEATMSAVRLARAFTKKNKIIKFEGCYHGHSDSFLVKAGSGLSTFSNPDSAGVTQSITMETLVATYNDEGSVKKLVGLGDVACIIVEPVAGNMGVVPPRKGFLEFLRKTCDESGMLLIFDEVITGFRLAPGGAQSIYGIKPDLTCLGKVIGGGMNIAAYGGRREIMNLISPLGPVYQAGTLAGNPVAVAAGIATLDALNSKVYIKLEDSSKALELGLHRAYHGKLLIQRVGSMLGIFFTKKDSVDNYDDVRACSRDEYSRFFNSMLASGIYLPPSPFETTFVSAAHSKNDLRKTIDAAEEAFGRSG